jgi:SNF2 family DNA or RNA helicase
MLDADTENYEWHVDDPEDCLMLVETLQGIEQQVDGGVRIEWPAGVKFKVTRAYGAADFKLTTQSSGDWFVAKGGLQLDEGTVIDMARLIEFSRSSGGRFVPLGEGGFVALTEDLRRRIDEFAGLGETADGGLKVHALAAGALEEIAEGTNWTTDKTWAARLKKVREAETLEAELPSTLSAELRAYQGDGFRWLARLAHWGAGACLADDMGLGKTVQALALLLRRAPEGAALVVAPTSICALWADEARRFAPTLNVQIFGGATQASERAQQVADAGPFALIVCSYTLLQQEIELFSAREWHTVVLDEAQAVKNFATKRAQAVFSLKAGFRIATTGTPVENRMDELWTLFRFLNPGLLGTRERFNERYAAPIERGRDGRARSRLRRLVRPFILRRTKSEVLTELPPRTEIVISVEPDARERAFYEALRRDALAAIEGGAQPLAQRRFQVLAQLMRLRRACCDPRLAVPDSGITGAKLEAFTMIVEELVANRHKALVFSQFTGYLALLRGELERMGVSYQYLDGSTPAPERARAVAAFQKGEGEIFLISLRAGGTGLNLTAADYVIIADPWWNPAVEDQAASRAHRMGQERPVTVYRLVVKNSVEERIMAMHQDKRALAEGLFAGEDFGGAVSVDELVRLMRDEA